ncbi:PfkB family carbohydrate kinase [Streptomyces rimosus]|uniref:PfkB family carbohydrate kinase n=1 Tax=Streptomyces rimosus TaxID=1927 RepID=UPI0037CED3AB
MQRISVIGNISRDHIRYPDGHSGHYLGGAALHIALAAARAGAHAAPVAVIGDDLALLTREPDLACLDWSALRHATGNSAAFAMVYDTHAAVRCTSATYGVSHQLTAHALGHLARHPGDFYHLCCRRPLHVPALLSRLATAGARFSADFFLPSARPLLAAAAPWLPAADWIFVNAAEYRLLARTVDPAVLSGVVVTDGPRPARLLHHARPVAEACPPTTTAVELTGAGDTLTGTFLARRLAGASPAAALEAAVTAAAHHTTTRPRPLPAPYCP